MNSPLAAARVVTPSMLPGGATRVPVLAMVTAPWPVPCWLTLKIAGANADNGTGKLEVLDPSALAGRERGRN